MTEHRKLPDPPKTLLERAESMFGLGGFRPAAMPRELAAPVNRRPVRSIPVADKAAPAAADAAQEPVPVVTRPVAVEQPIVFAGEIHPLDREALANHGLIQPAGQITALLEEFRIVKRRVLASMRKAQEGGESGGKAQLVLVTSPLPGEGKSYCAVNLALALAAEKDSEVLLVDADFGKPSVLRMLGLPKGPGFMDVLARADLRIEDCVLSTDIAGLHVLPAGNHTTADSEYLTSHRTAEVLAMLTRGAPNRVIIFDSPPALAASPAAELAKHVGQTIVVARADRTGQTALEDTLTLLSACTDLKLLLNAAHFSPSGRRFGDYYGEDV